MTILRSQVDQKEEQPVVEQRSKGGSKIKAEKDYTS